MAPVYADHPFPLIQTPSFLAKNKNEEPDMFHGLATDMCHVHNLITRGLNSIYLQAPHIQPADEKSFCRYIAAWCNFLHVHHAGEEALLFPTVGRMTGVKGLMDTNIDQHKALHDGADGLREYINAVLADREQYSGSKVVEMIDRFGAVLTQHLADEIETILGLRQYGDKLAGLPKLFDEEGEKAMRGLGQAGMVWGFANIDVNYENGMWKAWPPAPAPAKILFRSVFWWMNADMRKFGAVDRTGTMRPLYALPESS